MAKEVARNYLRMGYSNSGVVDAPRGGLWLHCLESCTLEWSVQDIVYARDITMFGICLTSVASAASSAPCWCMSS